jgi:hypothetical protein
VENCLPKVAENVIVVSKINYGKKLLWMAKKLSGKLSSLIHQMGRDRENRIIAGKTKLTVTQIVLMDDNWKIFREHTVR